MEKETVVVIENKCDIPDLKRHGEKKGGYIRDCQE